MNDDDNLTNAEREILTRMRTERRAYAHLLRALTPERLIEEVGQMPALDGWKQVFIVNELRRRIQPPDEPSQP